MMNARVMVVIPALNAEPWIGGIVLEARKQLPDVIVINDGSIDATSERAGDAGAIVLDHPRNLGKGAALKTGFGYALEQRFDAVISLDADGQHLPREIPRFIEMWQKTGADLIIGSRAHLFDQMLARRRGANRFSAATISFAAGTQVSDSQSGYRLYSSDLLRKVSLGSNGFSAESEVIVRAGRGGFRVVSMPIDLGFVNGVSTSHYRPVLDTVRIALRVLRTRVLG